MDKSKSPKIFGDMAEDVAANYLSRRGYEVIHRKYRSRRGEIDLVCLHNNYLVFVEVKSTRKLNSIEINYRVDVRKQKRLYLCALDYIQKHGTPDGGVRFDVCLLKASSGEEWKINHIINAFQVDHLTDEFL